MGGHSESNTGNFLKRERNTVLCAFIFYDKLHHLVISIIIQCYTSNNKTIIPLKNSM